MAPWIAVERVRSPSKRDRKINPEAEICNQQHLRELARAMGPHCFGHPSLLYTIRHRLLRFGRIGRHLVIVVMRLEPFLAARRVEGTDSVFRRYRIPHVPSRTRWSSSEHVSPYVPQHFMCKFLASV